MNLLVLDLETTDLEPEKGAIIELGAALYDTAADCVLWQYGTIVYTEKENTGEFVNKIPRNVIDASKALPSSTNPISPIAELIQNNLVDIIMAHNADFDRSWIEKKFGVMVKPGTRDRIPWLCTISDLEYGEGFPCRKLSHMALEMGITVGETHRALADVLLTIEVLRRLPDLEDQLQVGLAPRGTFAAVVSYRKKDLAKAAGFSWRPETKQWVKKLPLDTSVEATETRPFRLRRIG